MERVSHKARLKKARGWVPVVRLWAIILISARAVAGHCQQQECAKRRRLFLVSVHARDHINSFVVEAGR